MEFVTYIGPLFAVLFALHLAIRRYAQTRVRGNKVSWTNTWLTGFASVVITLLAIALLYAGIVTDHVWVGVGAFMVAMIGGQIAAARAIARRWPVEIPREKQPSKN